MTNEKPDPSALAPYGTIGAKLIRLQRRKKTPVGVPIFGPDKKPVMRKKRGGGGEKKKLQWDYVDLDTAQAWMKEGGNVGFVIGRERLVLDFDPRNFKGIDTEARLLEAIGLENWNDFARVDTPSGGKHVILGVSADVLLIGSDDRFPGVDFKRGVSYVATAGSAHPNGGVYRWEGTVALADTPAAPAALVELLKIAPPSIAQRQQGGDDDWGVLTEEQLEDALSHIDVEHFNHKNEEWFRFMASCHWLTAGEGEAVFLDWCAGDDEYADEAMIDINSNRWNSLSREGAHGTRPIGGGLLYKFLAAAGVPSGQWPQRGGERDFADVAPDDNPGAVPPKPRPNVFFKGDPFTQAMKFLAEQYTLDGTPTLAFQNGQWLAYDGSAYQQLKDNTLYALVFRYLYESKTKRDDEIVDFMPTPVQVNALLLALRGLVLVEKEAPCWRSASPYPAQEMLAAKNGLLHIPSRTLLPPTPNFFTRNAIDFDIDLNAPRPEHFEAFLDFMFGGDEEQVSTALELMGDDLCPNTRIPRIEWLLGPGGAGKSTLMDLRDQLNGTRNVISPSLSTFSNDHWGMAFMGKRRATFRDEKQPARGWGPGVATALCKLATNDPIDVNPKNKDIVPAVRFGIRLTIVANRMIYLPEALRRNSATFDRTASVWPEAGRSTRSGFARSGPSAGASGHLALGDRGLGAAARARPFCEPFGDRERAHGRASDRE